MFEIGQNLPPIGVTMAWLDSPWMRAAGVLLASIVLAFLAEYVTRHTLGRLARRTVSVVDDRIVEAIQRPLGISCVLVGAWYAFVTYRHGVEAEVPEVFKALLISLAVIIWSRVLIVCGRIFMFDAEFTRGKHKRVAKRLIPVLDTALKVIVFVLSSYYVMLAWGVDVSGWIASAGILGVAIGLAAQETLGNIMAGVALMVDGPYKLGDWLRLASGERGRVTDIGVRSTRLLTVDEVELVVPNSIMANSIVTNESGGPTERIRMRLPIGVAYGTDLEKAKAVIVGTVAGVEEVILNQPGREPVVLFREFGGSSLDLELYVWLQSPQSQPILADRLNMKIYSALVQADIEIPFETRSVYMHNVDEAI